jgi:hypothetical protein
MAAAPAGQGAGIEKQRSSSPIREVRSTLLTRIAATCRLLTLLSIAVAANARECLPNQSGVVRCAALNLMLAIRCDVMHNVTQDRSCGMRMCRCCTLPERSAAARWPTVRCCSLFASVHHCCHNCERLQ